MEKATLIGVGYDIDPLNIFKLMSLCSVYGEPMYSFLHKHNKARKGLIEIEQVYSKYLMIEHYIDSALDYDFRGTIEWASELRNRYNVQVLPQIIMVRASIHSMRVTFNINNPGIFRDINRCVISYPEDVIFQMRYYTCMNNGKTKLPSVLKRSWANYMESLSRSDIVQCKETGLIDVVRMCHAKGEVISELMRYGTVKCGTNKEVLVADIFEFISRHPELVYSVLLHSVRQLFKTDTDAELLDVYLGMLKRDVSNGKATPFDYYRVYLEIEKSDIKYKEQVLSTLEECIDLSMANMPQLSGSVIALSDNSVSAWLNELTEFSLAPVAEVSNFCAVVTACCSDSGNGFVGKFGDTVQVYEVFKRKGILRQARTLSEYRNNKPFGYGKSGIWEFWNQAIRSKIHWDNVFLYSSDCMDKIEQYIDSFKIVSMYRNIGPKFHKVNVFIIQMLSDVDSIMSEYLYRTNIMYGLTGREVIFADAVTSLWGKLDTESQLQP